MAPDRSLRHLDFDGVLLPVPRSEIRLPDIVPGEHLERSDWSLVRTLADVLQAYPEVAVVISSSWRLLYPLESLKPFLVPLSVIDTTGSSMSTRYEEIRAHVQAAGAVARA